MKRLSVSCMRQDNIRCEREGECWFVVSGWKYLKLITLKFLRSDWLQEKQLSIACFFIDNMIFDRHQFTHRLFHSILHNHDLFDIEILLRKSSCLRHINLNRLQYNGQSLVHLCCLYNRLDLLKLFVEDGECDILKMNADGWLPIHIAVHLGHMNIVFYLLKFNSSRWYMGNSHCWKSEFF